MAGDPRAACRSGSSRRATRLRSLAALPATRRCQPRLAGADAAGPAARCARATPRRRRACARSPSAAAPIPRGAGAPRAARPAGRWSPRTGSPRWAPGVTALRGRGGRERARDRGPAAAGRDAGDRGRGRRTGSARSSSPGRRAFLGLPRRAAAGPGRAVPDRRPGPPRRGRAAWSSSIAGRTASSAAARTSRPAEVEAVLATHPADRRGRRGRPPGRRPGPGPGGGRRPARRRARSRRRRARRPLPRVASPASRCPRRSCASTSCRAARRASSAAPTVRALLDGEPGGRARAPRRRPHRLADHRRRARAGPAPPRHAVDRARSWTASPRELADACGATVHALDRRGSGTGRSRRPRPLDVAVHVADLVAYLDARGIDRADLVGVSFGGVVALEIAARHPDARRRRSRPTSRRTAPSPTDAMGVAFPRSPTRVEAAYAPGGAPAAAETFLRAVAGDAAWERLLGPQPRRSSSAEGDGALADGTLLGLDPDGLARITAPVLLLTGGASDPFYAPDRRRARPPHPRRPPRYPRRARPHRARSPGPTAWPTPSAPSWSPPSHDRPRRPTTRPSGASTGAGNAAAPARGPGHVRPDRGPVRPDEPADLGVPGAALAAAAGGRARDCGPGGSALDVASGTGKVAADLQARVRPDRPRPGRGPVARA